VLAIFFSHLGDDEFAAILPNTDRNGTIKLAEQLRLIITNLKIEHVTSKAEEPIVTISIGLCSITPERSTTINMLLNNAKLSLQQAKQDSGNCTRIDKIDQ